MAMIVEMIEASLWNLDGGCTLFFGGDIGGGQYGTAKVTLPTAADVQKLKAILERTSGQDR